MPWTCLMSAVGSSGLSSGSGLNWVFAPYTIGVALKGESWRFLGSGWLYLKRRVATYSSMVS